MREKCKTCSRTLVPEDLTAGLCPLCLLNRTQDFFQRFMPTFDGGIPICFECSASVKGTGGYLHWDCTANSFALLCIPCSEKAIHTAGQYRGTEFSFAQKVQ